MRGSDPETQPPPLISFGPSAGWRTAGLAFVSAVALSLLTAVLTSQWLRPPVVDALAWAVGLATMLVVYRWLSVRARPHWTAAVMAWIGVLVLTLVIRLLLFRFLALAG